MSYTALALIGVALAIGLDLFVMRTKLLQRKAFWAAYAIMAFFQLITNGLLTGIPIVVYDPARIVGWHVVEAPVEDLLFGFSMIVVTLSVWVRLGEHARRRAGR